MRTLGLFSPIQDFKDPTGRASIDSNSKCPFKIKTIPGNFPDRVFRGPTPRALPRLQASTVAPGFYCIKTMGIFPVLDLWSPSLHFCTPLPFSSRSARPLAFCSRSARPPSLY